MCNFNWVRVFCGEFNRWKRNIRGLCLYFLFIGGVELEIVYLGLGCSYI